MAQIWQRFCKNLEKAVKRKPRLETFDLKSGSAISVQFPNSPLKLEMIVPDGVDCVVAETMVPAQEDITLQVLGEVGRLGVELGTGSIIIDDDRVSDAVWEKSEYQKQYYLPLHSGTLSEPDMDGLVNSGVLEDFRARMQGLLGVPVELEYYMDERPYVLSIDYHGPSEDGGKPPFHFYIHFYELTGAVYVEKVEIPEEQRGQGYGSEMVEYLKWFSRRFGLAYAYLEAKTTAEAFWESHGFQYLYRLNLRRQRRRERAIRRRPGWERSWVGDYRLQEPYWMYKNHPQDDIDFVGSLLTKERKWEKLASIGV